jgi:hypothetical protein
MATKNNPGKFDCYNAAGPDEPLFVLRSIDPIAPLLVAIWAALRVGNEAAVDMFVTDAKNIAHRRGRRVDEKAQEAFKCADAMRAYHALMDQGANVTQSAPPPPREPREAEVEAALRAAIIEDGIWSDIATDGDGWAAILADEKANSRGYTALMRRKVIAILQAAAAVRAGQ